MRAAALDDECIIKCFVELWWLETAEPPKPEVVVCDMPKPLMYVFPKPCTPMLSS